MAQGSYGVGAKGAHMRSDEPWDEPPVDLAPVTSASERSMPQDVAAERSVLSAMILSQDVLQDALVELDEKDFYLPSNRAIYAALREMFDRNQPVDPVSLADYLNTQGQLERVGGRAYLLDLSNDTFSLAGWRHHAEMLRRDSLLRNIIEASAEVCAVAFDAPEDTKEVVDKAEKLILDVTDREVANSYSTIDQVMDELYTDLSKMCEDQSHTFGVNTGFKGIDDKLLGLRPGQMVVIGARPGVGKTSFALNLVTQAAAAGASVAFFSLEMSKVEIAQRLLSSYAKIDLQQIRAANIHAEDWTRILDATRDLAQLDIMIDDTPGITVTEIRAKARRMLHEKEHGIVVVDYLQLLSPPPGRRSDSRATEVSEMSRGIKIMAKDLGVPVVALSQLNRGVENRTSRGGMSKRPQLSDLRESGSIEQDADIVILLDRSMTDEEAERDDRPDAGVTEFIIAKNRSGPLGIVELTFLPNSTKFVEVEKHFDE